MNLKNKKGFSLIELTITIAILSLIVSLVTPQLDLLTQKAFQSKAKGNLSQLRSVISIYYTDNEGEWPLAAYGVGIDHFTDGFSMTTALMPVHINDLPTPTLRDRMSSYNGIPLSYDGQAVVRFAQDPPEDVYINHGDQTYNAGLNIPFVYDNWNGTIYYNNGNLDTKGEYFYSW